MGQIVVLSQEILPDMPLIIHIYLVHEEDAGSLDPKTLKLMFSLLDCLRDLPIISCNLVTENCKFQMTAL